MKTNTLITVWAMIIIIINGILLCCLQKGIEHQLKPLKENIHVYYEYNVFHQIKATRIEYENGYSTCFDFNGIDTIPVDTIWTSSEMVKQ